MRSRRLFDKDVNQSSGQKKIIDSVIASPKFVQLADGRRLCYAEYGDPQGKPLFYCHGYNGSRLNGYFLHQPAQRLGVRVIAPERPGIGESDPKPGRTVIDWSDDLLSLAGSLRVSQFAVLGASGGGPFTAACAWRLPDRVSRAGFLAALGPTDFPGALDGMGFQSKLLIRLGRYAPRLVSLMTRRIARATQENPEKIIKQARKRMHPADLQAVEEGEHWDWLVTDLKTAFRQGGQGIIEEARMYAAPWGFPLQEIQVPTFLWQGDLDRNVVPAMGRYLAEKIPGCQATFLPDKAHISTILGCAEEALKAITE